MKKNVYLTIRTFTTGNRQHDTIFGISYSVFDSDGINYSSELLMHSLLSTSLIASSSSSSTIFKLKINEEDEEEGRNIDLKYNMDDYMNFDWKAIWKQNNWSMDYFDYMWKDNLMLLTKIQQEKNINCNDPTDVLYKFLLNGIQRAFKLSENPIFIDVNNHWSFLYERLLNLQDNILPKLLNVDVLDFKSFAIGLSRSSEIRCFKHYERFFEKIIVSNIKIDRSMLIDVSPEIYVFSQHILYIDKYLKQDDISQIIIPTKQLLFGLILLGIILGIIFSKLFF